MLGDIDKQRSAVVAEARSWISTPFKHQQRCKGAGTDCGQIISASYEVGLGWPRMDFGNYPPNWMKHSDDDFYVNIVRQHCIEIPLEQVGPGDIVLFHYGRHYSHGGIVTAWPRIVHAEAHAAKRVMEDDASRTPLSLRKRVFFSPKQWHA